MTLRRNLEEHRHNLDEIRNIMNSTKTLAYMETRKITHFLDSQAAVVKCIEETATDLLFYYPDILPVTQPEISIYILIGTERGFCGDYNHKIVNHLAVVLQEHQVDAPILVTIGHKLYSLFESDERVKLSLNGASVVEEVTNLINLLVSELTKLQKTQAEYHIFCIYRDTHENTLCHRLLPPFEIHDKSVIKFANPPDLNLSPQELLAELTAHYLFAALHEMLYTSLMAENYSRVAHLENAIHHLDDQSANLARRCNSLRQEEITEEIEVILLSASQLSEGASKHTNKT